VGVSGGQHGGRHDRLSRWCARAPRLGHGATRRSAQSPAVAVGRAHRGGRRVALPRAYGWRVARVDSRRRRDGQPQCRADDGGHGGRARGDRWKSLATIASAMERRRAWRPSTAPSASSRRRRARASRAPCSFFASSADPVSPQLPPVGSSRGVTTASRVALTAFSFVARLICANQQNVRVMIVRRRHARRFVA
jgi:hypothetical protein